MSFIDIFKTPIVLTYKKEKDFSTNFGICISMLTILILLIIFVLFSKNMYFKLDPSIIMEENPLTYFPTLTLNQTNHILAIRVSPRDNSWNKSEFNQLMTFAAVWWDTTGHVINLNKSLCQDVYKNVSDLAIQSEGLIDATCIKDFNFTIGGNPSIGYASYLTLYIFQCTNQTTSNIICKPIEEIESKLKYTIFEIVYVKNLLSPNDYKMPLKKTTDVYWDYLEYGIMKNTEFFYKTINIISDVGFLFPEVENKTDFTFDTQMNTKTLRIVDPRFPLLQVDVISLNKLVYVKRTYDKIQNVYANMSGVIKFVLSVGYLIVFIFNIKIMQFDVVNTFYDFSSPSENIENKDKHEELNVVNVKENFKAEKLSRYFAKNNIKTNNSYNISNINNANNVKKFIEIKNNDNKSENSKITKYISDSQRGIKKQPVNINLTDINNNNGNNKVSQEKKKSLEAEYTKLKNSSNSKTNLLYTYCDIIKYSICPGKYLNKNLRQTSKNLNSAYSNIESVLDLASMIKITHELYFLKSIMMNSIQMKFVDHMKKPKFFDELLNPDEDKMLESLLCYYKDKQNSEVNEVDKHIFQMVNEDLICLFTKFTQENENQIKENDNKEKDKL